MALAMAYGLDGAAFSEWHPVKARKFVQAQGYTFPVYLRTSNVPAPFDFNSIPPTVILGPSGRVAARHDRMAEYDTPEFKAGLDKLAKSAC